MKRNKGIILVGLLVMVFATVGCDKKQSATSNNKMDATTEGTVTDDSTGEAVQSTTVTDDSTAETVSKEGYNVDIEKDKADYNGKPDIVVGDNLFSTQINDWYINFPDYEGKIVEIEGYYIDDYAPYTFVGRYGPSCPYCNGGYVSFEFYTEDDLSDLVSVKDWIKVVGILREGEDSAGTFYYIEALSIEKMDKVGLDTVTN